MIVVTRLNDSTFAVNPDLVERIHESPDTTLVMVDGAKYIVTESMAEVIDMIARYRARIVSLAYDDAPALVPAGGRPAAAGGGRAGAHHTGAHHTGVHHTGPVALDPVQLRPVGRS